MHKEMQYSSFINRYLLFLLDFLLGGFWALLFLVGSNLVVLRNNVTVKLKTEQNLRFTTAADNSFEIFSLFSREN